jgi:neocarzinostatin family protein
MTIAPARGLSAGERVRVSVRGFPPGAKVFLSECARAANVSPLGCGQQLAAQPFLIAGGRGAASGSFTVQPAAATGPLHPHWAKCTAGPGCVLVATIGFPAGVPKIVATAPLRFAPPPAQPAPPAALPAGAPLTVLRRVTLAGPAGLLAAGAGSLFAVTGNGPGTAITRVSPVTGQPGPSAKVSGVIALAFGGGMLWVVRQAQAPHPPPLPVLALDPATLAIRHSVALPGRPGWGGQDVADAGGLIWVAGARELIAIDPVTARLTATVPLGTTASTGGFTSIAAAPGGTVLWTTEGTPGGGPISVQRRDPRTGAVLESAAGPAVGIGAARIAAAPGHAWLAYATGMLGSYVRAGVPATGPPGPLTEAQPLRSPRAREVFSNGVAVYLAGTRLWILDGTSISCADAATGRILSQVQGSTGWAGDLVPLAAGRLALAWNGQLLITVPRPPCGP